MPETPSSEEIRPSTAMNTAGSKIEQDTANDRAARLSKMLAAATRDVNYHAGETMLRGKFGDTVYSLLQTKNGYHIAMACVETAVHIDIALTGEVVKAEECPQKPKVEPGTEDQILSELEKGQNRFANPYANVDGLIGVIEDDQNNG
ncbi:hypothetical protein IT413_03895 [Candidatus Peregrinibacteria bacterium]|nr:hypothetical protein [Candidatus Peregrinibacteria bacterium]